MRRVYAAFEPKIREHLLSFHNGNKGFGHKLGAVLIVTADLRALYEIGERNQAWIDGGLFAMSLVYALHAARLGTCMLNWSVDCEHDQVFRKEFDVPDHEVIITFIGVGCVPHIFEVAASPAPPVDDILSVLSVR
jgi:nitroreductase